MSDDGHITTNSVLTILTVALMFSFQYFLDQLHDPLSLHTYTLDTSRQLYILHFAYDVLTSAQ